ncbi:AgmX/PglI C-terminal domain-containing protein [Myxococcota bacterium]|nr:AgmX/PglI C-terminal domain-containing protein [Myxococcota bacterium]
MKLHILLIAVLALNLGCAPEEAKKHGPELDPAAEFQAACLFYETGGLPGAKTRQNPGQKDVDFFFTRICRSSICQTNHFFTLTARLESYQLEQKYRRFQKFLTDQGKEARCEAVERTLAERRRETLLALVKCLVPPPTPGVLDEDERSLPACLGRAFVKPALRHAQTTHSSGAEKARPPEPEPAVAVPAVTPPAESRASILAALERPSPDPLSTDFAVPVTDLNPKVICGFTDADFQAAPVEPETLVLVGDECRRLVKKLIELAAGDANSCSVAKKLLEQEAGADFDTATRQVRTSLNRECARREKTGGTPRPGAEDPTAPTQGGAKPQTEPTQGGKIDTRALRKMMKDHRADVQHCYEEGLKRDPELEGTVRIQFIIELTGQVSTCTVSQHLAVKSVGDCICTQMKKWRWPKPEHDRVQIQYPWVFNADN